MPTQSLRACLTSARLARTRLCHGIPFRETLKVADKVDPCLIVLGSHDLSAVREMMTGSIF